MDEREYLLEQLTKALSNVDITENDHLVMPEYSSNYNQAIWAGEFDSLMLLDRYLHVIEQSRNRVFRALRSRSLVTLLLMCKTLLILYSKSRDIRCLNTLLKVNHVGLKYVKSSSLLELEKALKDLILKDVSTMSHSSFPKGTDTPINVDISDPIDNLMRFENVKGVNSAEVVVFSPSVKSSYTLAVVALLQSKGFVIKRIVIKRLFTFSRIKKELRRDGIRLIHKVIRKLILNDGKRVNPVGRNLKDTKNELQIKVTSVSQWARLNNVPVIFCDDFNEKWLVKTLQREGFDFGLFTGGGIVSDDILSLAKVGFINCHAGLLPFYRGMDVIEWPVIMRETTDIGCSVHFMSPGIDEGDIIIRYRCTKSLDVKSARYELESLAPYMLVLGLLRYLVDGRKESQSNQYGRHFYVMHPFFFELAMNLSKKDALYETDIAKFG